MPKGPSLDPSAKRMAVEVEEHPLAYAAFEGTIPLRPYGAGKVIVWAPLGNPHDRLRAGNLKFELLGHKLRGRWALVRMKNQDAFARPTDEFSVVDAHPDSVASQGMPSVDSWGDAVRADVSVLPSQAVKSALPAQLSPQLATRSKAPPASDSDWLCEIKFDGRRLLARVDGGRCNCSPAMA